MEKIKPFIKWAGGKTQLLEIIKTLLPLKYNQYFEPFLGGGAVFLSVQPSKATLSDINLDLVKTWNTIKNNKLELIKQLDGKISQHSEEFYYKIRDEEPRNDIDVASRFIYLNKTCFNGIYRVNSKGKFNVPYNKKDSVSKSTFYDVSNLNLIEKLLEKTKIINSNYQEILNTAKSGDFVFIDPPYDYEDSGFTSYTQNKWGKQDTIDLLSYLVELDNRGVKWMLTNHNTELVQNMMKNYQSFVVPVNRSVNSKGNARSNSAYEIIIINYSLKNEQFKRFKDVLVDKNKKSK